MDFKDKLQELRNKKGLTQEELAGALYVSRTAVSKWESGRGYPNIESLKQIAKFFSVTIDELLSSDEVLTLAEEDSKSRDSHLRDVIYGLLDLSILMLLFLPFFADRSEEVIRSVSLLSTEAIQGYLWWTYASVIVCTGIFGVATLALQGYCASLWVKYKAPASIALGAIASLLFIISSQPYAAVFALVLLAVKLLVAARGR